MVNGESSSPSSHKPQTKHSSSSSHRKSSSRGSNPGRHSSGTGKSGASASLGSGDQAGSGAEATATKGSNVCVVEPQSTSKATAVVAPLMAESRQLSDVFGKAMVKSDASKKHRHHHKVAVSAVDIINVDHYLLLSVLHTQKASSTYRARAFSCYGQSVWNILLPHCLRDSPQFFWFYDFSLDILVCLLLIFL